MHALRCAPTHAQEKAWVLHHLDALIELVTLGFATLRAASLPWQ